MPVPPGPRPSLPRRLRRLPHRPPPRWPTAATGGGDGGALDDRRPVAVTVIRRSHRYPSPAPAPSQRMSPTRRCTSGCSGHPDRPGTTTRIDRRSLALATNRRAMAGRGGKGGPSTTRSTPSIIAAVTSAHRTPGRGITASRARSMPMSWAATAPRPGSPTRAHHEPAVDAAASRASATLKPPPPSGVPDRSWPVTTMVLPRRRLPSGNRPARGGITGRSRVWLDETGRVRSARRARDSRVRRRSDLPARWRSDDWSDD